MTIKHIKELIGYLISLFSILEIVFHLESFTVATMTWLTVTNICVTNDHVICSVCGSYNPIFSLLTTYHGVCNKCNTTGATSDLKRISWHVHFYHVYFWIWCNYITWPVYCYYKMGRSHVHDGFQKKFNLGQYSNVFHVWAEIVWSDNE
jgi:hypothetical protein